MEKCAFITLEKVASIDNQINSSAFDMIAAAAGLLTSVLSLFCLLFYRIKKMYNGSISTDEMTRIPLHLGPFCS